MPIVIQSGAKILGTAKRRDKNKINAILAKEFRVKNPVSIIKLAKIKKKVKKFRKGKPTIPRTSRKIKGVARKIIGVKGKSRKRKKR